ncbi:MAG TPA: lytic transglycosylase domain-containing protein [Firmicutes bacterium]|nr:lytic transglycosylase domain-containing protein [Bacillota bacterium]
MKKSQRNLRILYLVLFLLLFYFFITQSNYLVRFFYPFPYRDIIIGEAQKNGLEPLLVAAVIMVESSFNEEAKSPKGALGLMQVMPETGFWAAEQMQLELFSLEQLFDPHINIAIGTWYLAGLFRQFNGNLYAALAAYNGGRGHVSRWLREGIWDGTRESLNDIPFPETYNFVLKVERTYKQYKRIY